VDDRHKYYHYYGFASQTTKCVFNERWNVPKPHIRFSKRQNKYVVYGLVLEPFMIRKNWEAFNKARTFVRTLNENRRVQKSLKIVD
jgi:hypothetical protein